MRVAWMVPALFVAACGQTGSGESMASAGNALTPEQVDAALGPEISSQDVPDAADNDGNALSEPAAGQEEQTAAPAVRREPQPAAEPADAAEPAEEESAEPGE